MLKTIVVHPEDIIKGTPYMLDRLGRLDLLGQILKIGYNIDITDKTASPAGQGVTLRPFTKRNKRGEIYNTAITQEMLDNSTRAPLVQIELANVLLEDYDIYLEVDQ